MLTVAEDIFQDVETAVMLLNGEVVRRAFEMQSYKHRVDLTETASVVLGPRGESQFCCLYAELLERCAKAEMIAKSAQKRLLDPLTESEKRYQPVWLIRQARFAYAEERRQEKNELLAKLGTAWLCMDCFRENDCA